MEQLEKVVKGLEFCVRNKSGVCSKECPYKILCFYTEGEKVKDRLTSDALALINAQQERIKELEAGQTARVMTLEEVKKHNNKDNCVWFELCDIVIIPVFVRQDRQKTIVENPCILSDQTIPHLYWKNIDYCKKWRCWTQRPTDEQRKTVKWDG